ncbi:MAG: hypothetical protein CL927_20820, partial [Deltaproteobacteria bacterium]|nr:hypothetical protein [Deltaproteobacteria bacterium]
ILATSRTPLLLHGEALLELLPLNDNDGLQLFQRRARAAGGQWADTPENRSAIQRIVRKVDALPLAIELAAARSRALTPMQIETRLSQRFQLLRGIRRGETDRHASLRGLIDWSWELLAPWEQASLAQLSVFRDGFFMESAEKVLDLSLWPDAPWALDVVGALLDKSLLYSMDSGSQPRFRMYRSVRAYAEERLEGAARGPRVRHLFHFSTLGADALLEDFFQTKRADLALMLQAERENLRVATETALGFGMPELGGRCALAMGFERQFQGPSEDVIHLIERVIERPISQPLLGRLHRRLGWLHYVDGRSDMAMARFEASRSIHHAIGETNQEAFAIGNLGNCLFQSGKVAQAIEHFEESLELHWEVGNRYGVGSIFGRLASAHETRGNRDKALQFHQRSLALARQRNDTAGEAVALHNIGQFLEVAGDPTQAQAHLRAAIKLAAQHHDHKGLAISMAALGGSLRDTGRFDEVPPLYAESMRLRREVGNRGMIGILLGGQGVLLLKTGDLEGAEHLLQEALEHLRNKRGFAPGLFGAWLAVVEARNGSIDAARRRIHAAAPQLEGFRPTLRGTLRCLQATVELLAGHREAYEAALTSAITINESSALGATSKLMRMVQEVRSEAVHLRGWRPPTAVTR